MPSNLRDVTKAEEEWSVAHGVVPGRPGWSGAGRELKQPAQLDVTKAEEERPVAHRVVPGRPGWSGAGAEEAEADAPPIGSAGVPATSRRPSAGATRQRAVE